MRAPAWLVPLLVVASAAGGVAGARLAVAPSLVREYAAPGAPGAPADAAALRTSVLVVKGVMCVDTAERAARQLDGLAGVRRLEAFASRARLEVTYDPSLADAAVLREAIEAPVHEEATGEYLFGLYEVVEMDGVKIAFAEEEEE
ncbi:hypothetical protein FJ250_00360 [bacterium]|nr:hypothetical protein [bacterium]